MIFSGNLAKIAHNVPSVSKLAIHSCLADTIGSSFFGEFFLSGEPISKSVILKLVFAVFQAKALQNRIF
jgi:hypothetical protein